MRWKSRKDNGVVLDLAKIPVNKLLERMAMA